MEALASNNLNASKLKTQEPNAQLPTWIKPLNVKHVSMLVLVDLKIIYKNKIMALRKLTVLPVQHSVEDRKLRSKKNQKARETINILVGNIFYHKCSSAVFPTQYAT